jgi:hypothetical protein
MFLNCQMPDRGMFLDVEACVKVFCAVLLCFFVWSFSMLSGWVFLVVVSPVDGCYISVNVDGVECLD